MPVLRSWKVVVEMIDHRSYAKILGAKTDGRARKIQSDMIMKATWWNDIQA
jgi:hypothetical protein